MRFERALEIASPAVPAPVTEPGVWRWGVHDNPDLPEAFHERRMHEFANLN